MSRIFLNFRYATFIGTMLFVFYTLSSCSSEATENQNDKQINVFTPMTISHGGVGGGGKAIWLITNGHTKTTGVIINDNIQKANCYEDHLTTKLPEEYFEKKFFKLNIAIKDTSNNNKSEEYIFIVNNNEGKALKTKIHAVNGGYGAEEKAIWVNSKNHTKQTKAYIDSEELKTLYYDNHITARIPEEHLSKDSLTVYLRDDQQKIISNEITIKK